MEFLRNSDKGKGWESLCIGTMPCGLTPFDPADSSERHEGLDLGQQRSSRARRRVVIVSDQGGNPDTHAGGSDLRSSPLHPPPPSITAELHEIAPDTCSEGSTCVLCPGRWIPPLPRGPRGWPRNQRPKHSVRRSTAAQIDLPKSWTPLSTTAQSLVIVPRLVCSRTSSTTNANLMGWRSGNSVAKNPPPLGAAECNKVLG